MSKISREMLLERAREKKEILDSLAELDIQAMRAEYVYEQTKRRTIYDAYVTGKIDGPNKESRDIQVDGILANEHAIDVCFDAYLNALAEKKRHESMLAHARDVMAIDMLYAERYWPDNDIPF